MFKLTDFVMSPLSDTLGIKTALYWKQTRSALTESEHFYLRAMGIDPKHLDLRISDDHKLVIPLMAGDKKEIVNFMLIHEDGTSALLIADSKTNVLHSVIDGCDEGGRIFCADFATAWAVWRATGRSVIIVWDSGQLKRVFNNLATQPGDCIAVDNLNEGSTNSNVLNRKPGQNSAIRSAIETGLPFYLSKPGASFSAMGIEQTQEIFSKPPVSDLPILDVHKLERIELGSASFKSSWFDKLSQATDPTNAASLVWSISKRLLGGVPKTMSLEEHRQHLEAVIKEPTVHPVTMDRIFKQLEKKLNIRRDLALTHVRLPSGVIESHNYEAHPCGIPVLNDYDWRGVIIIRAPMAKGKTQLVGKPFAAWAAAAGECFVAICHRITLASELEKRLELQSYHDFKAEADPKNGLAICLPSITLKAYKSVIEKTRMVFIDEISQVLRFLQNRRYCSNSTSTNEQVYEQLKTLVARATCVVVADVNIDSRTIKFLQTCRPGEKFRIIDVPHPKKAGIQADYYSGSDAVAHIACEGQAELESGGRIWIAAEAKTSTVELAKIFSNAGYKTLAIHGDNKGSPRQKRFLANIEADSLRYDVVIASPVISSGISVEHKQVPEHQRFTLGLYVGGGYTTTPSEAFQQLRRVRYLKHHIIGMRPGPRKGIGLTADAQIRAAEAACALEECTTLSTDFDHFTADIITQDYVARQDFAAGLLWQLDAAGWVLRRSYNKSDAEKTSAHKKIVSDSRKEYVAALISAPILNQRHAARLQRTRHRTEAQNIIMDAHFLRSTLNIGNEPLTEQIVLFWDRGRGVGKLDLFDSFRGIVPPQASSDESLISRNYPIARAKMLSWLFAGIDMEYGVDRDSAQTVIDKLVQRSPLINFLGIAPLMNGKREYPVRDVSDIFQKMGVKLVTSRKRVKTPSFGDQKKVTKGNPIKRFYQIAPADFERMERLANLRNQQRATEQFEIV
ncbi:putative DNA primase/helicase [Marinobacter sp. LV10R520-4]|uniref:plasmid replication protein, CyRepA1 family n=1 Tax=Marinobacter sp. LV10R520-4 TaxID=1761796 RepID=UPI000BF2E57A|nr:plasmid replication protein, CyRepA1 family [Marinobacter sp. LV10R520-4]PFG54284.1 putative DNA primase/helicase [Marinobacter sp. LV10R520-4]